MIEDFADDPNDGDEIENGQDFAEMLDAYGAGFDRDLQIGDKATVKIISIGEDTVFVDTGAKIDGVVEKRELCDEKGECSHAVGDSLELYVVEQSESEIRLSRAISGIGGLTMLREAFENRIPVEGRVAETCKGGFRVEILQRRAFCPVSQIDVKYVETPESYVGGTYEFMITKLAENGRNIVVNRRQLLQKELEASRQAFLSEIQLDDVVQGTVTRIMPYGAFVELSPGVEGMVHISELSWSRVDRTETVVGPGDTVTVRIIGLEPKEGSDRMKVALSVKQAQEDPWTSISETFAIGERVKGRVTRCMDFGAFVEIAPGIEGLVHVSEMSYTLRVTRPEDVVSPGQTVAVMIRELTPEQRRISLSMRDAEGDPWMDVMENFSVGQRFEGTVQKRESFGIFVTLAPGITGLLHKSKIGRAAKPSRIEKLGPGDPIPVLIEKIDVDNRRIALNVGEAGEEGDWKRFAADTGRSVGTLGEQLQQAMKKKHNG